MSFSSTPKFLTAEETLFITLLICSWTVFTVAPFACMPTVTVATSGFTTTLPSPITSKVVDFWVVTEFTVKGIGPKNFVYKKSKRKKVNIQAKGEFILEYIFLFY